jgi:hypothetical protein
MLGLWYGLYVPTNAPNVISVTIFRQGVITSVCLRESSTKMRAAPLSSCTLQHKQVSCTHSQPSGTHGTALHSTSHYMITLAHCFWYIKLVALSCRLPGTERTMLQNRTARRCRRLFWKALLAGYRPDGVRLSHSTTGRLL